MNNSKKYQSYINKIQKIRGKNNVNWMDILRLAFKHAPKEASAIMRRINSDDKISISFFFLYHSQFTNRSSLFLISYNLSQYLRELFL